MKRWNISSAALFVLGFMAVLMLLIVVLPDVDLPDTAFHRGTAPIVVHSQATSAPVAVTVADNLRPPQPAEVYGPFYEPGELAQSLPSNSRPILFRSIRR